MNGVKEFAGEWLGIENILMMEELCAAAFSFAYYAS